MQKQLLIRILKNRFNFYLLFIMACFSSTSCFSQKKCPNIDIGVVKEDVISKGIFFGSEDYIKNLETPMFKVFYYGNKCLVHIPFKNSDTNCDEKYSLVVLYYLKNNKWIYTKSIPYYYSISLIDEVNCAFISRNLTCKMDGSCSNYSEVSIFKNDDMELLAGYYGMDRSIYYHELMKLGRINEVKKFIGDTIVNKIMIENISFDKKGFISFHLIRQVVILSDVKDSLITKSFDLETKVEKEY